jgi:hypothetical protein
VLPDVLRNCSAFIFRDRQSKEEEEEEEKKGTYSSSKLGEPLAQ